VLEESLRYDTPLTQFPRRCRRDGEIAGVPVAEGDLVVLSMPSGNRDRAVWGDDAEEFRVDRFADATLPEHFGFGMGIHHCVGAYLARHTAQLGLTALLDGVADLRLAPGYRYEKVLFFEFRRPCRLDVEFSSLR
jgi:cytochrome P450